MATAKVLQRPQIIEIIGSTIRVKHPDLTYRPSTRLAAPIAAAGTAASFYDNNGFKDDDWFIIGKIGDYQTEECDVDGTVTRGQSVTITNSLKFPHELDADITKIEERAIKIYGASSDGGSGTLIASIDAITTPIADAFNIQWNRPYTEYTLISTDTTYAYYYVVFTDGVTVSEASEYVVNTGVPYNAAAPLIRQALESTNTVVDGKKFTYEMLLNFTKDFENEVSQFSYQDARTGLYIKKDWNHEIVESLIDIAVEQNEDEYDLETTLGSTLKYIDSGRAIINVQIGDKLPLNYLEIDEFTRLMRDKHRTAISDTASAGDTEINVYAAGAFPDSGTLLIGSDTISYTGKTDISFTGIPTSGDGSITTTHNIDDAVWNNVAQGEPRIYTLIRGKLRFNVPPSAEFNGYPIRIRYYRKIPRITQLTDILTVPFVNICVVYLKYRIEERKQNVEKSMKYQADFKNQLIQVAMADSQPLNQTYEYYYFDDAEQVQQSRRIIMDI